jgi:hypothetical protein
MRLLGKVPDHGRFKRLFPILGEEGQFGDAAVCDKGIRSGMPKILLMGLN